MTTPNEDWRPAASAKAATLIYAGDAVFRHLNVLADRIQFESGELSRATELLERHQLAAKLVISKPYDTEIDFVARQAAIVDTIKSRRDALIAQRDRVQRENAEVIQLASAAKDLSRKFDLEAW